MGADKIHKIFVFICVSLIVSTVQLPASQVEVGSSRYIVRAWAIEDGLPQNSILSLIQTRDGYIWLGTQSGLVRFDGVTFKIYNQWNTRGLKNDRILALYEDRNGALWVGTKGGGVSRLKDGEWTAFTTGNGLANNTVSAITGEKDILWIGTGNGLNRLEKGGIQTYTLGGGFPGQAVTALAVSRDGTLWIGTGSGLNRMKNNKFPVVPPGKNLPGIEITALHEDRSGTLWIGAENGLYYLENREIPGAPARYDTGTLEGNSIRAIREDTSGSLWIGTDGEGLHRLKDGVFTSITTSQGLPDDFIYSLEQDHEGNLWLGTFTNGLVRLKHAAVDSITTANGLPENRVQTILRDENGYLWVGTDRKGVSKVNIKNNTAAVMQTFTSADGLSGNRIRSLCLDKEKNLWIGTTTGLNKMKNGKIQVYTTADGLSSNRVTAIFQDMSGTLWVGTVNGLNRFAAGKFFIMENIHIRTLGQDRGGSLRVGTVKGLFILKDGKISNFAAGDESLDFDYDVLALYEGSNGDLWIGTNGRGLIRFKQGKPGLRTIFTTGIGLPGNYIFSIDEDSSGNLWMSSYSGVFRVSKKELTRENLTTLTAVSFDEKEGMRSRECVPGGQPAAWKTPGGKLFIPTVKGVAIFEPGAITPNRKPPAVIIEDVLADNRSIIKMKGENKSLSLSPETRVVEFYFTALSFTAPGKVRFRYRLEGYDAQWKDAVPRQKRAAFYLNLPAGDYCFHVTACNNAGVWNRSGARFEFAIQAPFYKRPVFYALVLLCLAIIVGISRWLFVKHKKNIEAGERDKKDRAVEKYKTSALLPETVDAVLPQLTRLMEEEKVFLEPNLTLKSLSQRLYVHYNHLSQIINEHLGKSFNDYINRYRIEEAKKKLTDPHPKEARKTILDIAYETGFYSKSVFNTAFKKFTGMTPSQFREKKQGL